jgi:hypothetical protein
MAWLFLRGLQGYTTGKAGLDVEVLYFEGGNRRRPGKRKGAGPGKQDEREEIFPR